MRITLQINYWHRALCKHRFFQVLDCSIDVVYAQVISHFDSVGLKQQVNSDRHILVLVLKVGHDNAVKLLKLFGLPLLQSVQQAVDQRGSYDAFLDVVEGWFSQNRRVLSEIKDVVVDLKRNA